MILFAPKVSFTPLKCYSSIISKPSIPVIRAIREPIPPMKKRLIESNLPLADISEAAAREKNIRHGHHSTLHI